MREYAKAEPLLIRAEAIRRKSLGPDHPDTAWSLNGLAVHYDNLHNYARAETFYKKASKSGSERLVKITTTRP